MFKNLPIFPPEASTSAQLVDRLYFFMIGMSLFGSLLVAGLLVVFAWKYRKRSKASREGAVSEATALELLWTAIPLCLFLFVFFWAASIFFHLNRPPDDAMEIRVVGKRWMWKLQHLNGHREINELHVPVGRAVKLMMTSEDVIHSFFVPAFRIKADVLPGRYTTAWFKATKPGTYHLFCAEYCGTKHSSMIGSVVVMEPSEFQGWLTGEQRGVTPVAAGEKLFMSLGCVTCHNESSNARGPSLAGAYGKPVKLEGGQTAQFDEEYVRESILTPQAKRVEGFTTLMPTFKGLVSEEGVLDLIEYIKSLGAQNGGGEQAAPAGAPQGAGGEGASKS